MPKIRVEVEVSNNCKDCFMFDGEYRYCELFDSRIDYDESTDSWNRCEQCKQAEVEECHKFRYKRHWKACQTCKYHECRANCNTCEINPLGSVLSCPCLSPDDSKKYARCKYYKPNTAED